VAFCAFMIHLLGLLCVCMISKSISQVSMAMNDLSYWSLVWYTYKRLISLGKKNPSKYSETIIIRCNTHMLIHMYYMYTHI